MNTILKTSLAAAFATSLLAGTGFAADNNGGHNDGKNNSGISSKPGSKSNDGLLQTDPSVTGSIKCDDSAASIHTNCDKQSDQQK